MTKVEIIHFTGMIPVVGQIDPALIHNREREFAARLLAFTKNTRLQMSPSGFEEFLSKPWAEIEPELEYMSGSIPSSWEFIDVTFTLRDVSRACAQQITRTRFTPMDADLFGSYAMQTMRTEEMDPTFHVPEGLDGPQTRHINLAHEVALNAYKEALSRGMTQEQARGLLPLDTHSNLVVKYNLRMLVDLLRGRDSLRAQGEYQQIAMEMKRQVIALWPWSATFFEPKNEKAVRMIEEVAKELKKPGAPSGLAAALAKAADLLKK